MKSKELESKDFLGNNIDVGDTVVFPKKYKYEDTEAFDIGVVINKTGNYVTLQNGKRKSKRNCIVVKRVFEEVNIND